MRAQMKVGRIRVSAVVFMDESEGVRVSESCMFTVILLF